MTSSEMAVASPNWVDREEALPCDASKSAAERSAHDFPSPGATKPRKPCALNRISSAVTSAQQFVPLHKGAGIGVVVAFATREVHSASTSWPLSREDSSEEAQVKKWVRECEYARDSVRMFELSPWECWRMPSRARVRILEGKSCAY